MDQRAYSSKIQELKLRVKEMLTERAGLAVINKTASPSSIWGEATSVFSYLMNLSDEDLKNIRYHTGLIDGDSWSWLYWSPFPVPDPAIEAEYLGYIDATKDIPESFWIGEPPTPGIPRPMGVNYKRHIINANTVRFQRTVSYLYRAGLLTSVLQAENKQLVLEIGGGFGGLAHALGGILGKKATYIYVDLPDMFLFSGTYLTVNNPDKNIYIYDSKTFSPDFLAKEIFKYDYVLVPNYALKQLQPIKEISFIINMQSFQEMSDAQVEEYVEFGVKRITRYFYSDNVDRHPLNNDLDSVTKILGKYFDLYPPPAYYDNLYSGTNLHWTQYYKKYLGIPKDSGRTLPKWETLGFPQKPKFSTGRKILRTLIPRPVGRLAVTLLQKIAGL